MNDECPHCGQRMLVRHGVQLSPKLADIFDAIESGVGDKKELIYTFYGGRAMGVRALIANISHINKAFEFMESPIRIRAEQGGPYRVIK